MRNVITGFMAICFIGSLLSALFEGGGFVGTRLTAAVSDNITTLTVVNTDGFLRLSYVFIEDEKIKYTSKNDTHFYNCTRGYDGTKATEHGVAAKVYSPAVGTLNAAAGFNIASTGASVGMMSIPTVLTSFFVITVPRIVTWDYPFLKTGWLLYLRLFLSVFTTGFIIWLAYEIAMALGGILQSIFVR